MENMNENIDVTFEEIEETDVDFEQTETGNSGLAGKVLIGAIGTAAVVAAVAVVKGKDKFKTWKEQRDIKKMQKKGYVVIKSDDVQEIVEVEADQEDPEE